MSGALGLEIDVVHARAFEEQMEVAHASVHLSGLLCAGADIEKLDLVVEGCGITLLGRSETRAAESADVCELVLVVEADGPALESAHGKTGYGPMHAVGEGTVPCIDHRNDLLGDNPVEGGEVHDHTAGPSGLEVRLVGERGFTTVHHHQHGLALAGGDEVVHDVVDLALDGPAGLVFTASVEEIEDWIALGRIAFILRRNIDVADSPGFCEVGVITLHTDLAVRDFLFEVVVYARFRNLYTAGHHAASVEQLARRVGYLDSVDMDEIVVESWHLRLAGDFPHAVGVLCHRIQFAEVELDSLGFRGNYTEGGAQVGIDHGILLAVKVGGGGGRFGELCR